MGYSNDRKAYRIFNTNNNDIIISRDVVFLEGSKVNYDAPKDFYYPELVQTDSGVNSREAVGGNELTTETESIPQNSGSADNDSYVSESEEFFEWSSPLPEPVINDGPEWTPNPNVVRNINTDVIRRSDRIANRNQNANSFCAMQYISNDPENLQEAIS